MDDRVGNRAEQRPIPKTAPVRARDDQIRVPDLCRLDNDLGRIAHTDLRGQIEFWIGQTLADRGGGFFGKILRFRLLRLF